MQCDSLPYGYISYLLLSSGEHVTFVFEGLRGHYVYFYSSENAHCPFFSFQYIFPLFLKCQRQLSVQVTQLQFSGSLTPRRRRTKYYGLFKILLCEVWYPWLHSFSKTSCPRLSNGLDRFDDHPCWILVTTSHFASCRLLVSDRFLQRWCPFHF